MMNKKKETAEQQLLKLIEASPAGGAAVAAKASKQAAKKQSLVTVVRSLNKILVVGIVIVSALLINEIIGGIELVNRKITFQVKPGSSNVQLIADNAIPKVPGINLYLSKVEQRNLFQPYEKAEAKPVVDNSGGNRRISQMAQKYKLVGVSWMDQLDTVSIMIEDRDKGLTYYKKKGDTIDGITVKEIYKDSALLGYDNEEIMIKYDKSQM